MLALRFLLLLGVAVAIGMVHGALESSAASETAGSPLAVASDWTEAR